MIPQFKLSNSLSIPTQGLGTYTLHDEIMTNSIRAAYQAGCTLIDTAYAYENEHYIGNSIKSLEKEGTLKRENLFLQTKVGDRIDKKGRPIGYYFYNSPSCPCHDTKKIVFEQVENSLKQLQTDYLDLVMIHWPYYDVLNDIWRCLEELYAEGLIKSIGVSNCKKRHIERILKTANVVPMVNQINISPINTHVEDYEFCKQNQIQLQAYSPLYPLRNETFKQTQKDLYQLADKYGKTMSQIILRWYFQKGIIPVPKSANPSRVKQNYDIYNFELTNEEVLSIDNANFNFQYLTESKFCPGY